MSWWTDMRARLRPGRTLEQKINPVWQGPAVTYSDLPTPVRMRKNYKTFVAQGFKEVDTLYKCVSYIARNGGAIEPKLYTDRTMQKEIERHPLLDQLRSPNPEQSGVAYREAVLGFKLLAGNSFQYAIRPSKNGPPTELWPLRPDQVQILATRQRGIVGYKHDYFEEPIPAENIGHAKYWNPDDDEAPGMGMSPLEAAALSADMLRDGKKWNLALLQNSARPAGIWSTPNVMSFNDRARLEEKLAAKFAGFKNAGKFPVLDGGLTWQAMGLPPAEMEFLELIKYNGGAVANVYNMPPQLIGDTSSTTYDNMDQAKQASYTEAIFPDLDDLYALWNVWLVPMYPDLQKGAYLYYDKESVEVIGRMIQEQKDAKADRANKLWQSGLLMLNEAREMAGVEPHDQGEVFRVGQVLIPAAKLMEYAEQQVNKGSAPGGAPGGSGALPPGNDSGDGGNGPTLPDIGPTEREGTETGGEDDESESQQQDKHGRGGISFKSLDLESVEQKQGYADAMLSGRAKWERDALERFQHYFDAERAFIVTACEKAALPTTVHLRAEHVLNSQANDLKALLTELYEDVGMDIGGRVLADLVPQKSVAEYLKLFGHHALTYLLQMAAKKVRDISESTRAQIQSELEEGVRLGESVPKLAKRIDHLYLVSIIPNRSKVIAHTEVHVASSFAAVEAAKSSGLTLQKVWLATDDGHTRPDHREADGQTVDLDGSFMVGGEQIAYPGDGSAKQAINCRCTVYFQRVKAKRVSREHVQTLVDEALGKKSREVYRSYWDTLHDEKHGHHDQRTHGRRYGGVGGQGANEGYVARDAGSYTPQKSVKEAVAFMQQKYPHIQFDIASNSHIDAINSTFAEADRLLTTFPDVSKSLRYIGDTKGKDIPNFVKGYATGLRSGKYAGQAGEYINKSSGVMENYIMLSPKVLRESPQSYGSSTLGSYNPQTAAKRLFVDAGQESIFTHEFGHTIHNYLGSQGGTPFVVDAALGGAQVKDVVKGWSKAHRSRGNLVSSYAAKNERENFAEGFVALSKLPPKKWPQYAWEQKRLLDAFVGQNKANRLPLHNQPTQTGGKKQERQLQAIQHYFGLDSPSPAKAVSLSALLKSEVAGSVVPRDADDGEERIVDADGNILYLESVPPDIEQAQAMFADPKMTRDDDTGDTPNDEVERLFQTDGAALKALFEILAHPDAEGVEA